jgi:MFS family permease
MMKLFCQFSRDFWLIIFSQWMSLIGSELTLFVLGVLVWQQTGSTMQLTFVAAATLLPEVIFAPLAGVVADRWDRRHVLILSDSGAGLSTLALLLLLMGTRIELWHIYLLLAVRSTFHALQWPAYSAATTLLVEKEHLSKAHALWELNTASARTIAPLLGGVMFRTLSLQGAVLFDFATFLCAVGLLLISRIPTPVRTTTGRGGKGSLIGEVASGWSYITARPGLKALLFYVASSNLYLAMTSTTLLTPLVLSFASRVELGWVMSAGGTGLIIGCLVVFAGARPRKLVYGVMGSYAWRGASSLATGLTFYAPFIALLSGVNWFFYSIQASCSQAIWQKKVAPDMQGRVIALRRTVTQFPVVLSRLMGGVLADYIFEPLLVVGGPLAPSVGRLTGVGPGRGIAFMYLLTGLLLVIHTAQSLRNRRLTQVEAELPDVDIILQET